MEINFLKEYCYYLKKQPNNLFSIYRKKGNVLIYENFTYQECKAYVRSLKRLHVWEIGEIETLTPF
jgi:hypothetical protein